MHVCVRAYITCTRTTYACYKGKRKSPILASLKPIPKLYCIRMCKCIPLCICRLRHTTCTVTAMVMVTSMPFEWRSSIAKLNRHHETLTKYTYIPVYVFMSIYCLVSTFIHVHTYIHMCTVIIQQLTSEQSYYC